MKHKVIIELDDGYYHTVENDDLVGPFPSLELAQLAYDAHVKWASHDHYESRYVKIGRDFYD